MTQVSWWKKHSGTIMLGLGIIALFGGYLLDGQTPFEVSVTCYLTSLVLMLFGVRHTVEHIVDQKADEAARERRESLSI